MNDKRAPIVVRPEDRGGVPTAAGGDIYSTLARGEQTDGSFFLTHSIVPPGGGPRPTSTHGKRRRSTLSGEKSSSTSMASQ